MRSWNKSTKLSSVSESKKGAAWFMTHLAAPILAGLVLLFATLHFKEKDAAPPRDHGDAGALPPPPPPSMDAGTTGKFETLEPPGPEVREGDAAPLRQEVDAAVDAPVDAPIDAPIDAAVCVQCILDVRARLAETLFDTPWDASVTTAYLALTREMTESGNAELACVAIADWRRYAAAKCKWVKRDVVRRVAAMSAALNALCPRDDITDKDLDGCAP